MLSWATPPSSIIVEIATLLTPSWAAGKRRAASTQ
jgi:hypothetical protein